MAVLIWLGIYPVITLVLAFVAPYLTDFPLPVRTLILTLLVVPTMVFGVLPVLTRLLGGWLRR